MKRVFVSFILVLAIIFNLFLTTACEFSLGDKGNDTPGGTNDGATVTDDEVILLVDASYSAYGAKEKVDLFVKSVIEANKGARLGIVTFGYDQVYAAELSANTSDIYSKYLNAKKPVNSATNIADAIDYASGLFKTTGKSKIVVISDGVETDGDAIASVKAAAKKGIVVDTICLSEKTEENELQIVSVKLPDTNNISLGKQFMAKVILESSYSGAATIKPLVNGVACPEIDVQFFEGVQTLTIPYTVALQGLHELSVEIVSNGDSSVLNNVYTTSVNIETCDRILVIENIKDESAALLSVLDSDLRHTVVNVNDTDALPDTVDELFDYDQIVLVNVAYKDMPEGFDLMLSTYVYQYGGGLFTICGNEADANPNDSSWTANAYTREDMYGTVYQEMLPVEVINYTPPVAVMIIIDSSGSMHYDDEESSKFGAAKRGAKACLDALTERDYVGIMTLSGEYEDAELIPRVQRDKIIAAIDSIDGSNGGNTVFSAAIERAGQALSSLSAVSQRHIILVTDGENDQRDMERYRVQLRENANRGITMSIVGIQCSETVKDSLTSDLVYYANCPAENFRDASDFDSVSQEMRACLQTPEIKDVNYYTFQPTIGVEHNITSDIDEVSIPKLDGFYGVRAKAGADIILMGEYVPIYTQWKYGKGSVGTFACDLNGTWSSEFIASETGVLIINRIVHNLFPLKSLSNSKMNIELGGDNYRQTAMVMTELEEGQYLELTVKGLSDGIDSFSKSFTVNEIDGRAEFCFEITERGIYEITAQKKDSAGEIIDECVCYKSFSYSKEYDAFYDNEMASWLITSIAKYGKGKVIDEPTEVFTFNASENDDANGYNVSVLDVRMVNTESRYSGVEVDVVCYGVDKTVDIYCNVIGESFLGGSANFELSASAYLRDGIVTTVSIPGLTADDFYSYEDYVLWLEYSYSELYNLMSYNSITARVNENDPDESDNSDNIFIFERSDIKILYASTAHNVFMESFINAFRHGVSSYADVEIHEYIYASDSGEEIPTVGYDVYIYESCTPAQLPTDGVSIIFDPDTAPLNSGFALGNSIALEGNSPELLSGGKAHPILKGVDSDAIQVTRFREITASESFTPILYCGDYPVAFASEGSNGSPNVVLFAFSFAYSDFALLAEFPIIMYNIITHYIALYSAVDDATAIQTLDVTYGEESDNDSSDHHENGIYILDGTTYYLDLYDMYVSNWEETRHERKDLTKIQFDIILMYFYLLSVD